MSGAEIRAVAPRLSLAWEQQQAEREWRRELELELLGLERLVAHRELQFLRAGSGGDRRYVSRRSRKLQQAKATVRRYQQRLSAGPKFTPGTNIL